MSDISMRTLGERFGELVAKTDYAELGLHWAARALSNQIISVELTDPDSNGWLTITLEDGARLKLGGDYQSCCESLYITCDDYLPGYVGGYLRHVDIVEADDEDIDDRHGDVHEQTFVKVETTQGTITLCWHNEHNGYYGGIDVRKIWLEPGEELSDG